MPANLQVFPGQSRASSKPEATRNYTEMENYSIQKNIIQPNYGLSWSVKTLMHAVCAILEFGPSLRLWGQCVHVFTYSRRSSS